MDCLFRTGECSKHCLRGNCGRNTFTKVSVLLSGFYFLLARHLGRAMAPKKYRTLNYPFLFASRLSPARGYRVNLSFPVHILHKPLSLVTYQKMSTEFKEFSAKKTQADVFDILISADDFLKKTFLSPRQRLEHDMGWYSLAIWIKRKSLSFQESWSLRPSMFKSQFFKAFFRISIELVYHFGSLVTMSTQRLYLNACFFSQRVIRRLWTRAFRV